MEFVPPQTPNLPRSEQKLLQLPFRLPAGQNDSRRFDILKRQIARRHDERHCTAPSAALIAPSVGLKFRHFRGSQGVAYRLHMLVRWLNKN